MNRRTFLGSAGGLFAGAMLPRAEANEIASKKLVSGQAEAAAVGNAVLASGGNAVDAIFDAALVAGVVAVPLTGIGGYGGHLTIAGLPKGKVISIDFNSTAPAALKPDQSRSMIKVSRR